MIDVVPGKWVLFRVGNHGKDKAFNGRKKDFHTISAQAIREAKALVKKLGSEYQLVEYECGASIYKGNQRQQEYASFYAMSADNRFVR